MLQRCRLIKTSKASLNAQVKYLASSTGPFPAQSQVVIAGAGVVANSVAYHLVQNGWNDITVIEQRKIGSGTSNFGSGILGLFKPISHRNVIWYSINLYKELQSMGYDVQMKQCGSLNLAQTKDRLIALKRRVAYNLPTGLHCELLSSREVQDLHPYVKVDDLEGRQMQELKPWMYYEEFLVWKCKIRTRNIKNSND